MSLAALHTDAHRRLLAVRSYPARLAMSFANWVAVALFKADPATVAAMNAWHAGGHGQYSAEPPSAFTDHGHAPTFALLGVAARKPMLVIGALAAFAALPVLLLFRYF